MGKKMKELNRRLDLVERNSEYHIELIRLIMDYLKVKVENKGRVIVGKEEK